MVKGDKCWIVGNGLNVVSVNTEESALQKRKPLQKKTPLNILEYAWEVVCMSYNKILISMDKKKVKHIELLYCRYAFWTR